MTPHHRRRWTIALVALLVLIGSEAVPISARTMPAGPAPIDLAALVPGVLDLEAVGASGFVLWFQRDEDLHGSSPRPAGTDPADWALDSRTTEELDDAGFMHGYEVGWLPVEAFNPAELPDRAAANTLVSFYAIQLVDKRGAAEAFQSVTRGKDPDDGDKALGDRSSLVQSDGTLLGTPSVRVDATVQIGTLVVGVSVQRADASSYLEHERDTAAALIERFVDGIAALDHLPTTGLGLDAVRFTAPDVTTVANGYVIRDGQSQAASAGQSRREREDVTRGQRSQGIVSWYWLVQQLAVDPAGEVATPYTLETHLFAFETAALARTYIAGRADGARQPQSDDTVLAPPNLGDSSVAVQRDDGTTSVSSVAWADGPTVYEFRVRLSGRFADQDAIRAWVDAEQDCLRADDCLTYRPLPAALVQDSQRFAAERPAAATPASTPTGDATMTQGAGVTYTDQTAGFSVTWNDDLWRVLPDPDDLLTDRVVTLAHPAGNGSHLSIDTLTGAGATDASRCVGSLLDRYGTLPQLADRTPARDADGDEISGEWGGLSWAAEIATYDGGPFAWYVACAELPGDAAVVFLYSTFTQASLDQQFADVEAVIASLEMI